MKSSTTIAAAIALAVVWLAAPTQASPPDARASAGYARFMSGGATGTDSSEFEAKVVKIVNKKRVAHGCHKLKINSAVHRAAQRHTNKMAAANELSHKLKHEPALAQRLNNAGYHNFTGYGENVAYGYTTPKDVVKGWLGDKPHRKNLLKCAFKDTGVGYAEGSDGQPFWTQDFGRK